MHILIGVGAAFTPWVLIAYIYFLILDYVMSFGRVAGLMNSIPYFLAYICSFEIVCRMALTSPFVPYEFSKYIMILLLIIALIGDKKLKIKRNYGILIFILTLPSIFIFPYSEYPISWIVFNLFGVWAMALGMQYFSNKNFTVEEFTSMLYLFIFPVLSASAFALFRSPTFNEINFSLTAEFETTGGFGSNQVSTIFSAALLFIIFYLMNKLNYFRYNMFSILFAIIFSLQVLLSFSRGGAFGFVLAIIFATYVMYRNKIFKGQIIVKFLAVSLLIISSFIFVNILTDGLLVNRYKGETTGTLAGYRESTLNTLTSRRYGIAASDLRIFINNIFFGVGPGISRVERMKYGEIEIVPHVEFTRLLAEHGIFGIFIILVWISASRNALKRSISPIHKALIMALIVFAIATSVHSAMRTFVTPMFMCFAVANVKNNYKSIAIE